MAVNIDSGQFATVTALTPRDGSCLTKEIVEELATLLQVKLPKASDIGSTLCASKDPNNLFSVDGDGCGLVTAVLMWDDELTWDASSGDALEFTGFEASGIDGTVAYFNVITSLDSTEDGLTAKKDPSGTFQVRPSFQITEITTTKITIQIYNAEKDVNVKLRLFQFPVPNASA